MSKDFPVIRVSTERELKDTGQPGRPFFTKAQVIIRVWFFGVLIFKHTNTGNFPEPETKR